MSQVTIYLPESLARQLRREAKAQRTSVSAFIASTLRRALKAETTGELEAAYGSWQGRAPVIEDPPPEERDPL